MEKWGDTKITRRRCLDEWDNTTCSGSEWLIQGRTYTDETKNRFLSWKFVVLVDYAWDLWDAETEADIPLRDYLENVTDSFLDILYMDGSKEFIEACNRSIEAHNNRIRRRSA